MKSCVDCHYCGVKVQPDKSMVKVCRFKPPTASVVPVPQGGQLVLATMVTWPPVEEADWCGEFAPRLA